MYNDYDTVAMITLFAIVAISLLLCAFTYICNVFIFRKAGFVGWQALIPIYNTICMLDICGLHPALILLSCVPGVSLVFAFYVLYRMMSCYNMGIGMFLLVVFIPIVGCPIWAFSSKYPYCGELWSSARVR